MLLLLLVCIPFIGGLISLILCNYKSSISPRWNALTVMFFTFLISLYLFLKNYFCLSLSKSNFSPWISEFTLKWIPQFGIKFHLALDGLSLLMILLTSFLGIIAIICSWNEVKDKSKNIFYSHILWAISFNIGIFLSIDLFLFFCFWELAIIPIYFLIIFWGNQYLSNRKICLNVANKFFIYGQTSGLLMLMSILGLTINYYHITNSWSFDYECLLNTPISSTVEIYLMLGLFLSFIIKMPIVPFHSWFPNMHEQAPTSGSIELVGLVIKTAIYGLIRFCIPLFPKLSVQLIPIAIALGLLTAFYAAFVAYSEYNVKRLISYSSISHMGVILTAIYTGNLLSYQGIILQIITNSLSTSALFILFGKLYSQIKTMDIREMGGLWKTIKWLPGLSLFFVFSYLSVPGTGNFISEFMMLLGVFKNFPFIAGVLLFLIIFSSIYFISMIHNIYYGREKKFSNIYDIKKCDVVILLLFVFLIVLIGLFPEMILDTSYDAIYKIHKRFFSYF